MSCALTGGTASLQLRPSPGFRGPGRRSPRLSALVSVPGSKLVCTPGRAAFVRGVRIRRIRVALGLPPARLFAFFQSALPRRLAPGPRGLSCRPAGVLAGLLPGSAARTPGPEVRLPGPEPRAPRPGLSWLPRWAKSSSRARGGPAPPLPRRPTCF